MAKTTAGGITIKIWRKPIRLGLVQTACSDNVDENLATTAALVRKAAKKKAKIVCLQELFTSPYFAQIKDAKHFKLAEKIPGKISQFLARLAKENNVSLVGGSFFELGNDGKYYNTCLVFNPAGKVIAKYRKVHIPHDPSYFEQCYFAPGNLGYVQVKTQGVTIAPLICYDQWFPEAARANKLQGAQIVFYPTAIGWIPSMKKYEPFSAQRWEDAMRAHASMNAMFTVAVNRVGKESNMTFWGGSFIADPFGQIVARASRTKEQALVADIDMNLIDVSNEGWRLLYNRRPETYGGLVE